MKINRFVLFATLFFVAACTDFREEEMPVSFGVDETELAFPEYASTRSVTVSSGTKWDITSMPNWITLPSIYRNGHSPYEWIVDFNAAANDGYDREGTIRIKAGSDAADISVTQAGKKGKYIAVESVSLSPTELTLTEEEYASLTYTITPSNASIKDVTWKSSSPSVATVSQSGRVDAISEGTALITLTTEDGKKTASCAVTVKAKVIPVTGVSLDKTTLSMNEGDVQALTATVSPTNATDKSVTWSSNNTAVATVSSSGIVTAKTAGSATITVKTNDGAKTASCVVTVIARVTGVSLDRTTLSLTEGETATLKATITPSNATDKSVAWSSSNTAVATVSSDGVVTAKSVGSATITVKTNDGGKTVTCLVTVHASTGFENGHEWVDLGLPSGLKWATCNVGASKPEEYGDYYAWGEVNTKNVYSLINYKFRASGDTYINVKYSKYNTDSNYGTVDNKITLELSDDAARQNWGGNWHMPTRTNFEELLANCTFTRITWNNVYGYEVTSKKNGNSIFLPAAGIRDNSSLFSGGYYWSDSLNTPDPSFARNLILATEYYQFTSLTRFDGCSVRPVTE